MPIAINGSGTVTGISVGGLPDGIVDTDMLAAGAVTAPKRGAGAILQVVQTFKNDSFSTSSTSYVDITGFSVSITPSQASSNILLLNSCGISTTGGSSVIYMNLLRGSTAIAQPSVSTGFSSTATIYPESINNMESWSFHFLDTPTYTLGDTITYKWQTKGYTGTQHINNRNGNDMPRTATMIAMEVAG
jgi:hypothetical protein